MKYEFHPDAELELYEAAAYYEASLPGLGGRFGDEAQANRRVTFPRKRFDPNTSVCLLSTEGV